MPRRQNPTILLVENDAGYRATLRDGLEEAGYRIIETSDAESALDAIADSKPNVAIVDVRLVNDEDPHDHSGLKLIRKLPTDLPVIVITAHNDAQAVRNAYAPAPGLPTPKAFLFKGEGVEAILPHLERTLLEIRPSSSPWYREPPFLILVGLAFVLILTGGLYIALVNEGNQLVGIIVVGVLIEVIAAILLRLFKIGE